MAKGGASKSAVEELEYQEVSPVNTDELEYALFEAERRVLQIQTKLHRWAGDDPHRRFDDLFSPCCRSRVPSHCVGSGTGG